MPPYMLPSPLGGCAGRRRALPLAADRLAHHGRGGRRRPRCQHRSRSAHRADLRAVALGATDALSLHDPAADRADRGHCAADPDVGGRGHGGGDADRVHHFAGAHHCQHDAGPDQRGGKPGASFPDAQCFARATALQVASAARGAVAVRGHPHCQRHFGDRRDHRRTLCRVEPRGRRRTGLLHSVRVVAVADRLSVCAWCLAATVLGFSFFFLVMFLEWYFLHRWHESARTPEAE